MIWSIGWGPIAEKSPKALSEHSFLASGSNPFDFMHALIMSETACWLGSGRILTKSLLPVTCSTIASLAANFTKSSFVLKLLPPLSYDL